MLTNTCDTALDMLSVLTIAQPNTYSRWETNSFQPNHEEADHSGSTLDDIRGLLAYADQCMATAQQLDPVVLRQEIPQVDPSWHSRHSTRVGRFLNAPLTDLLFVGEVKDVGEALDVVSKAVCDEVDRWEAIVKSLELESTPLSELLHNKQEELFELRVKLFDDISLPPPGYDEMPKDKDQKLPV